MATKTRTLDDLVDEYAQPIADEAGLDLTDYDRTASGLADLLRAAADGMGALDATRDWLEDAAADLDALNLSGVAGDEAQTLLARVDGHLYAVKSELC